MKPHASVKVLIPAFYTFPEPYGAALNIIRPFRRLVYRIECFSGRLPSVNPGWCAQPVWRHPVDDPSLLDLLRLPNDLFQVFVSIDVIISRFGTLISAMHYVTIGLIGTMALVGHIRLRWFRMLRVAFIGTALIVPILFGVRTFYSTVVVAPYTMADMLKSLRFLGTPAASQALRRSTGRTHTCWRKTGQPCADRETRCLAGMLPARRVSFGIRQQHGPSATCRF